ncbi:hypothetical protein [Cerasicoccus fimbriatus]|uniref:hypothetical protein n=1 Tax=Cerasicoccus fimbriatus TaxID=3014554 RepID=UPI0022B3F69C|nr:hypothetical protein [Cerasicoccus sp. TK19100]
MADNKTVMTTVSFRIPQTIADLIDELVDGFEVERSTIMRRLVVEGVEGLVKHRDEIGAYDWPRKDHLKVVVEEPGKPRKKH